MTEFSRPVVTQLAFVTLVLSSFGGLSNHSGIRSSVGLILQHWAPLFNERRIF